MIRFWRPDSEGPPDELSLVACVASSQHLWVITEGPSIPPPKEPWSEHIQPEMLFMTVTLASGFELRSWGGSGGSSKSGRQYIGQFDAPPKPSEPLIVKMTKEDGTGHDQWNLLWEIQAFPVH